MIYRVDHFLKEHKTTTKQTNKRTTTTKTRLINELRYKTVFFCFVFYFLYAKMQNMCVSD